MVITGYHSEGSFNDHFEWKGSLWGYRTDQFRRQSRRICRPWLSASSWDPGEWLSVEPDDNSTVNAIQVNFADIDKLYTSVMVYDSNSLMVNGLNKDVTYYFSIDSFNESGIAKGTKIINK